MGWNEPYQNGKNFHYEQVQALEGKPPENSEASLALGRGLLEEGSPDRAFFWHPGEQP